MDGMIEKTHLLDYWKKYKMLLLFLALGIVLLSLPEKEPENVPHETVSTCEKETLEDSLAQILSQVSGVGKVEVLLTFSTGEQITYQTDEDVSGTDIRRNTVLVTGTDREETGLIRQIIPPAYQGAIIVCQGADSACIRLAIVEAVMGVTGLSSDRISVLKMK